MKLMTEKLLITFTKLKLRNILIDLIKEYLILVDTKQNLHLETYTLRQLINVCFIFDIDISEFKDIENYYEINNI